MTGAVAMFTAFTSWWTSTAHDKQETIRVQASFTQSQQKEAYAAFYGAIDQFRDAVWAELGQYRPPDAPNNPLAPPAKESFGASINNLLLAESRITFYGSVETHKTADEVVRQMWKITTRLGSFLYSHPNYPNLSDAQYCDFSNVVWDTRGMILGNLRDAQANFRNAARTDLGQKSLPPDPNYSDDPFNGPPPAPPVAATAVRPPSPAAAPGPPLSGPVPRCVGVPGAMRPPS
jgi:hypothetical protein